MPVAIEAGKAYSWCSCGLSQSLPLCDNSHKNDPNDRKPVVFVAEKTATVYLCSCTGTQEPPYCDGFTCDFA